MAHVPQLKRVTFEARVCGNCSQDAEILQPLPRPVQLHCWRLLNFRIRVLGCQLLIGSPFPSFGNSLGELLGPGLGSLSISLVRLACKAILKKQFLLVLPGVFSRTHQHWDRVRRGLLKQPCRCGTRCQDHQEGDGGLSVTCAL